MNPLTYTLVCSVATDTFLPHSYIASLEEQQLSLLDALRELYRRAPDDTAVRDTMMQLQARGFDVGTLTLEHQKSQSNSSPHEDESPNPAPEPTSWDYGGVEVDNLETLLAQPATPQVVSDFLWNFGDAPNTQEYNSHMQDDTLFNFPSLDGPAMGFTEYNPIFTNPQGQTQTFGNPSPSSFGHP